MALKLMENNKISFYLDDFYRTLFPLKANKFVIEKMYRKFDEIIANISSKPQPFLPQTRVFADKGNHHLRRTVKLDPFAEYYIYDLVYKYRNKYRKDFHSARKSYGYRFENGILLNTMTSYSAFKSAISSAKEQFSYVIKFDISSYFNSIYQHDLVQWFQNLTNSEVDTETFGQFLRQINSGRSIDCLPQGIIPTKILGSQFLKFIDNSSELKSELLLRFMDDIYLFSNIEAVIFNDFYRIQELLGLRGLSVNPSKTTTVLVPGIDSAVDKIKVDLLKTRRWIISHSGVNPLEEDEIMETTEESLTGEQIEYLMSLLQNPNIEEEDAELALSLLREKSDNAVDYLEKIILKFPNLIKNIYYFSKHIHNKEALIDILKKVILLDNHLSEYQLFWLGCIIEDVLKDIKDIELLLFGIYNHKNSTIISKSKILEIPDQRFGLSEIREEHLRSGRSDWLSWTSAVGTHTLPKISRNHLLQYFANGSEMNKIISESVISM